MAWCSNQERGTWEGLSQPRLESVRKATGADAHFYIPLDSLIAAVQRLLHFSASNLSAIEPATEWRLVGSLRQKNTWQRIGGDQSLNPSSSEVLPGPAFISRLEW
ncbi:MAG: hypothetical protein ACI8W8_000131 [Rhodothermales bacterium]|jgi:hypothetical protein